MVIIIVIIIAGLFASADLFCTYELWVISQNFTDFIYSAMNTH